MAELCGFDPMKYGVGPMPDPDDDEDEDLKISAPSSMPRLAADVGIKTIPVGLLFPGQGSQYVKMLSTVRDIPEVQKMLKEADEILGYSIQDVCFKGPEEKLEETRHCQPAMFIAGLAGLAKLKMERPEAAEQFQVTAGLSLGEYTALCAAGVFSFKDGLKLVMKRGQYMQEAAQMGRQAMVSVAGIDKVKLDSLCKEAEQAEGAGAVCKIANELFPKGFSCAGTEVAITKLRDLAEKSGALQAKVLKTSGGFHTVLMAPAKDKLGKELDAMLPRMSPPRQTVYMNATAQPIAPGTPPAQIVELLKQQLTSPVLWEPSVRAMIKAGVTEFYEVGPMKQIKAMMKRIDSKIWGSTFNVDV
jgi:[acyl-carrier-protein] S-malonyltransferase